MGTSLRAEQLRLPAGTMHHGRDRGHPRTLARKGSSQWVLDADIAKCFDRIDHAALLARLPVFTTTIRRWLKAGVVELGALDPTTMGTPQGGIISPLLANIALDGMERLFGAERPDGRHVPLPAAGSNRGINLIRYADDFVVTAPSREVLEDYVIPRLTEFLAGRGLELSEAKTRIVHIDDGFDFLGFNLRHFPNGKLLVRPQKEKVAVHRRRLSAFFRANRQLPTAEVIKQLSPVIRGWCNYYRYAVAKRTFSALDHHVWRITYKWAKRRHPSKNRRWVVHRYYGVDQGRGWDLWRRPEPTPAPQRDPGVALRQGQGQSQSVRPEPARLLGGSPQAAAGARSQSLPSRPPAATAGGPVRGLQGGLRSGPRAGRRHQHRRAPRPRHRRHDPGSRPPLVPSRTVPAIDVDNAGRCLSRMRGDPHVRF